MKQVGITNNELTIYSNHAEVGMFALKGCQPRNTGCPLVFPCRIDSYEMLEQLQRSYWSLVIDRFETEPFSVSPLLRAATYFICTQHSRPEIYTSQPQPGAQSRRKELWHAKNQIIMLENALIDYIRFFKQKTTPKLEVLTEPLSAVLRSMKNQPESMLWMARTQRPGNQFTQHATAVCMLALHFGHYQGLDQQSLMHLGLAALIHDLGELALPKPLIDRNREYLSEDRLTHQLHVNHGATLLKRDPRLSNSIITTVREHHEWVNGRGYPENKKGYQLSQAGKMLALADCYDAMTNRKFERRCLSSQEAMEEILGMAGSQFDATLAIKFIEAIGIFPVGTLVELSNGDVGLVLSSGKGIRLQPKIIVKFNHRDRRISNRILDLSQENANIRIDKALLDGTYGLTSFEFYQEMAQMLDLK